MFTRRLTSVFATQLRCAQTTPRATRPVLASSQLFNVGSFFSTAADPAKMGAAKDLVDAAIKENDVLVFSKSWCPYCRQAKNILHQYTDNMKVYELDEMDDGAEIQGYLQQKTGQRTVPQIFLKQEFIGGCSDLQALSAAEIKKRIQ